MNNFYISEALYINYNPYYMYTYICLSIHLSIYHPSLFLL